MKRLMIFLIGFTMVFGLSAVALADDNVVTGVATQGTGGLGSIFAPTFPAVGARCVFKRTGGTGGIVRAADCCIAGDTYKLIIKKGTRKRKVKWTSSGSLKADCIASSTFPDQRELSLTNVRKAKLKAIDLPGGAPADAFITMEGTWIQKKGTSACGW